MNVVDLEPLLSELAAAPPAVVWARPLGDAGATARTLVWVPRGASWEAPAEAGVEHAAFVLEGRATWRTGEERQTLASGHLVTAAPGALLAVENDGEDAGVIALVTATRPAGDAPSDTLIEGPA
ncbi:MAG: hypothetical protein H6745_26720 [Deltaproteobacteria bacterium]|nr:hypothetical protein [Deltaproteobacteria bacterium]